MGRCEPVLTVFILMWYICITLANFSLVPLLGQYPQPCLKLTWKSLWPTVKLSPCISIMNGHQYISRYRQFQPYDYKGTFRNTYRKVILIYFYFSLTRIYKSVLILHGWLYHDKHCSFGPLLKQLVTDYYSQLLEISNNFISEYRTKIIIIVKSNSNQYNNILISFKERSRPSRIHYCGQPKWEMELREITDEFL